MSITIDSTNPRVIADNIRKLDDAVQAAASELPEVETTDEGKVLTVNASGEWAALDLPPYPVGNLDYSETEQDTGVKWIDGSDIYRIVFTGTTPKSDENYISLPLVYDKIISFAGTYLFSNQNYRDLNRVFQVSSINAKTAIYLYKGPDSTTYDIPFTLIVYYTKPAPSPAPGNREPDDAPDAEPELKKVTRKKTTKKEEE